MPEPIEHLEAGGSGRHGLGECWVFCELGTDGGLAHVSRELLGAARRLVLISGRGVGAVVLGSDTARAAREAVACGADRVYVMDDPTLARFDDERVSACLCRLVLDAMPAILLGGATAVGRAVLPRLAVAVHTGLTADCTRLDIDPDSGRLLQTRPAFGGNVLATIVCERHRPQMATVRPGVFPAPLADAQRVGEIIRLPAPAAVPERLRWLAFRPRAEGEVDLRAAEVIVTAGYGAGGPAGVELVRRLAHALGGAVGASRAVVDAGWLSYPHQVGQTGTTVQPKLYVACGVSGAIQHIVGMQNSATIVAINKDPDAPVFQYADVALVGDVLEVIPELLRVLAAGGAPDLAGVGSRQAAAAPGMRAVAPAA